MPNRRRDGFPLADQFLQELAIDLAHINASLRRPLHTGFAPESGSVVAAVIQGVDDKALLKRYLREGGVRILKPENLDMEPFESG